MVRYCYISHNPISLEKCLLGWFSVLCILFQVLCVLLNWNLHFIWSLQLKTEIFMPEAKWFSLLLLIKIYVSENRQENIYVVSCFLGSYNTYFEPHLWIDIRFSGSILKICSLGMSKHHIFWSSLLWLFWRISKA